MRGRADVSVLEPARHCATFVCPCQFVERHLTCKPRGKSRFFLVCRDLCSARTCDSLYFIGYSIFVVIGVYALYAIDSGRKKLAAQGHL